MGRRGRRRLPARPRLGSAEEGRRGPVSDLLAFLQNATAVAFGALGVAVAITWARRRDRSLAFLALAIVLFSAVLLAGRLPMLLGYTPPLYTELTLVAFMASGYALLRYRASLIPFPRGRHAAVIAALVTAGVLFFAAEALVRARAAPLALETATGLLLVGVWGAAVAEPIARFWIVSNGVPAVQRWRLRSLSVGFAALVAILVLAIGLGSLVRQPAVQLLLQVVVLAIVPLLYASFAPPAWLRREWRAGA